MGHYYINLSGRDVQSLSGVHKGTWSIRLPHEGPLCSDKLLFLHHLFALVLLAKKKTSAKTPTKMTAEKDDQKPKRKRNTGKQTEKLKVSC